MVMTWTANANDRLLLSAIADRLIFGAPHTFSRDDARELARLLPVMPGTGWLSRLLPDISAKGSLPGRSTAGFAAGLGGVSLKGDHFSFDLDSRGRRVVRAGQWKLIRSGQAIEIEQVMADDGDEGRTARVEFRQGEPVRMCLLMATEINIGPLSLAKGQFQPWKVPDEGLAA
jgi:hypothetical protein